MDAPPGIRPYLPWFAAVGLLFAFGLALAFASGELSTLAWLKTLRPADGLVDGPAIYRGRLLGPEGRVDPTGAPAALYRAWVESTDDDNHDTYCLTNAHDRTSLETPHGTFALAWLDGNRDIPLMGDVEFRASAIDVDADPAEPEGFSGPLSSCAGDSRESRVHSIPPGATVEVVACAKDGALGPCEGVLENVLATRGIAAHRARRADAAAIVFRVAEGIAFAMLVVVGVWVVAHRAKAFEQLRPEKRA